jgi:hypothetical protein
MFKDTNILICKETDFNNIYRITSEDGLILDIYETTKPLVNQQFKYKIYSDNDSDKMNTDCTIMNGIVFEKNEDFINVSFGGLLSKIPNSSQFLIGSPITIVYSLKY